ERPEQVAGLVLMSGYYCPTVRPDAALFSAPAIPVIGDLLRYTISPLLGWLVAPWMVRKLFSPSPVARSFEAFPMAMALRPWQLRALGADSGAMVPAAAQAQWRYGAIKVPLAIIA